MDKGLRLSGAHFDGLLRLYIIYNRFTNFKLKRFFFYPDQPSSEGSGRVSSQKDSEYHKRKVIQKFQILSPAALQLKFLAQYFLLRIVILQKKGRLVRPRKFGLLGRRMGSLRYIQNYSLKLNDQWNWWMVMLGAMPVEILTAKLNSLSKNTNK